MTDKILFDYLRELVSDGIEPKDREAEIWATYGQEVAIFVLDSVGFSRTTESSGIVHFLSKMMQMRERVMPVFDAFKPIHLRLAADNIFAAFSSPDDAISAAVQVQAALKSSGIMLNQDEPFQACIGIGFGKLLFSQTLEGYFGDEMNLASKLGEDVAKGGEILITTRAWSCAQNQDASRVHQRQMEIAGMSINYFALDAP